MTDDDEIFRYLEREIKGDKGIAALQEMQEIYAKYMLERGPEQVKRKLEAVQAAGVSHEDPTVNAGHAVAGF